MKYHSGISIAVAKANCKSFPSWLYCDSKLPRSKLTGHCSTRRSSVGKNVKVDCDRLVYNSPSGNVDGGI